MGRAPCCEKMGVKKGPWSPEEDQILISYINQNGHGNWRALPKQAGLLRCGKSCRLRWTNYLRPDIKRGNFSNEEEELIIKLHQELGNRWSAIAASLPGRTDNEIKNVWHTHLKKKLKDPNHVSSSQCSKSQHSSSVVNKVLESEQQLVTSPQQYSSELSSITNLVVIKNEELDYSTDYSPKIDETFWSDDKDLIHDTEVVPINDESMDFWYNLFIRAGDMPDLPEF